MINPLQGPAALPDASAVQIPAAAPPASEPASRRARLHRMLLLACGAAVCAYLLRLVGPGVVLDSFRLLSWRLVLVVVFPAVLLKVCDTLGWRCALPGHRVPFWRLATTVVAGQAVSSTTPTGAIGGDATKVWLLRDHVSRRESLSSLIIVETVSTASQGLFLLIGILIARRTLPSSAPLLRIMEWLLALEILGVGGFIAVQIWGVAGRGHALLARFGLAGGERTEAVAAHVDRALASFYRQEPRRLLLAVAFHFLGWLIGALEVWLILYLLQAGVSMSMALLIEAFGTGISFATFFLPVQLGVDEGGAVATFLALGLNGATGMSLTLIRRVREMVWIGIGMLILASRTRSQPAPVVAEG